MLKRIRAGVLDVAYRDVGPADGPPVILLHGFPYDVHAFDVVAETLAGAGQRCLVPSLRGFGATTFVDPTTPRSGQQAALGADLLAFLDALKIDDAILAGYDWGGRAACVVAGLWPVRARGVVSCGIGYNIQDRSRAGEPVAPEVEHRLWYQHYFQTERGRVGLAKDRGKLCRLLWRLWSPTWRFSDDTFSRTALSFDNPDFVNVVVHSYRHRMGTVPGDPALDAIEDRLATQPPIAVPAIILYGGDDGVTPPPADDPDAARFEGRYERRIIAGAGHNMPQEASDAFVEAVLSLAR